MRKKTIALGILALCLWCSGAGAQDSKSPLTKDEILKALQPVPGKRVEQGDLAGAIADRGIGFKVDEKTLAEFRKAGARGFVIEAIQKAAEEAARPKLQTLPAETETPEIKPDEKALARREPTEDEIKRWPFEDQARYHAGKFLEDLPNFVVNQIVSRSYRTPEKNDWQPQDKLEIESTYSDKDGEKFKLLKINDRDTTQSYEALGGATSTGEFGGMIAALVSPQTEAQFKEIRAEQFRGRKTRVFDFVVKKANSVHVITDKPSGRKVTTGYQGTIWVDAETARILRVEHSADGIPASFPLTVAEYAVEYDWVTIAGNKYFMPVSAEMILGNEAKRFYQRNVVEFRNYRVFETDVKVILEKDPPPQ
jgi:hypothetical protein